MLIWVLATVVSMLLLLHSKICFVYSATNLPFSISKCTDICHRANGSNNDACHMMYVCAGFSGAIWIPAKGE